MATMETRLGFNCYSGWMQDACLAKTAVAANSCAWTQGRVVTMTILMLPAAATAAAAHLAGQGLR